MCFPLHSLVASAAAACQASQVEHLVFCQASRAYAAQQTLLLLEMAIGSKKQSKATQHFICTNSIQSKAFKINELK